LSLQGSDAPLKEKSSDEVPERGEASTKGKGVGSCSMRGAFASSLARVSGGISDIKKDQKRKTSASAQHKEYDSYHEG